jgi:hypothetical protein
MQYANLMQIVLANGAMVNGFTGRDVAQPSIQRVGTEPTWSPDSTLKHERERGADARLSGLKRLTAPCRLPTASRRPSLVRLPAFSRGG